MQLLVKSTTLRVARLRALDSATYACPSSNTRDNDISTQSSVAPCKNSIKNYSLPIGHRYLNFQQCNSSSNRSPYRIQCNSSSNRSPYRIQCNSSSNRSPYRIQCNSSSNRSSYRIQCNSSSNRSPYYSIVQYGVFT